jgi:hypothetical protein
MSSRFDRAMALRWLFLGTGIFLLCGGGIVIGYNTMIRTFAAIFLPDDHTRRAVIAVATFFPFVAAALCLTTARGLQLGRSWARLTGIWASFLLIGLFSWLSLAGFWSLWALRNPLKMATPTAK